MYSDLSCGFDLRNVASWWTFITTENPCPSIHTRVCVLYTVFSNTTHTICRLWIVPLSDHDCLLLYQCSLAEQRKSEWNQLALLMPHPVCISFVQAQLRDRPDDTKLHRRFLDLIDKFGTQMTEAVHSCCAFWPNETLSVCAKITRLMENGPSTDPK